MGKAAVVAVLAFLLSTPGVARATLVDRKSRDIVGQRTFSVEREAAPNAAGAAATLADVTEMRILHSPDPDHTGVALSSTMLIDNLTAVPEPSALILLAWSPLFLKRKRRFAKNAIL